MRAAGRLTGTQLLLIAVLVLSLALRLRFVSVPLERDEGEYAYIAWLMHDGGVPYTDAFDQKPPGVFFIYLLIMKVFGFTTEAIHLGMYLWSLGTIALVYCLGRLLFSPSAGLLAAAVFSVASISPAFLGTAANTEIFMTLPLAAAAYLAAGSTLGRHRLGRVALCGLMVGMATAIKQVAATDGVFFALVMMLVRQPPAARVRSGLLRGGAFAAGAALPWLGLLGFFGLEGALHPMIGDALLHNLHYARVVPLADYVDTLRLTVQLSLLPYVWPVVLMAVLGLVIVLSRRGADAAAWWFVPGWLLASCIGVAIGGIFRQHYFLQTLAALALLAGHFLDVATRRIAGLALRIEVCTAAVMLPLVLHLRLFFVYTPDEVSSALYPGNPFVESQRVAALVAQATSPSDTVLIVGSEPQILFYARRRNASRYILTYPLTMDVEGAADRQVEMVAEVEAAKPRLIVVVNVRTSHLAGPWTSDYLFQHLRALLARDYVRVYPAGDEGGATPPLLVFARHSQ